MPGVAASERGGAGPEVEGVRGAGTSGLERPTKYGESPVVSGAGAGAVALLERAARTGGATPPRLNTGPSPIAQRVA